MERKDKPQDSDGVNETFQGNGAHKLQRLAINNEGFIFDPTTGESYTVNQTGIAVLKVLEEGRSIQEAAVSVAELFDITPEEAEKDIVDFVNHLKALYLL